MLIHTLMAIGLAVPSLATGTVALSPSSSFDYSEDAGVITIRTPSPDIDEALNAAAAILSQPFRGERRLGTKGNETPLTIANSMDHPYYPRPFDPRELMSRNLPVFDTQTGVYRPAWLVDGARQLLARFPNLIAGDPRHWITAIPVSYPWGGLIWDHVVNLRNTTPQADFNIRANIGMNFGLWMAFCGYAVRYTPNGPIRYAASPFAYEYTTRRREIYPGMFINAYHPLRRLEAVSVLCPGKYRSEEDLKRSIEEYVHYHYQFPEFRLP